MTSRSTASIVRANVVTPFNAILLALGVVTLVFGDWRDALFLGIIVTNSGIGIWQELRAKRKLDELAALVAPRATVVRDGESARFAVREVVEGDLVRLAPGDQVVADGPVVSSDGLQLDESILTGESRPVPAPWATRCGRARSSSRVRASFVVSAVGDESYAERIAGEAREFRHPRSPLERAINRLLYVLVAVMVPLGAMLIVALWKQDVGIRHAVDTAVAGMVTLVPEGLVLLVSITYAAAALGLARRGALAQQLNAIESLASVDTLCIDKTGTLTEAVAPRARSRAGRRRRARAAPRRARAASRPRRRARNLTLEAIADGAARPPEEPLEAIPFSRGGGGARCGSVTRATCSARRSCSRSARSPTTRRVTRRRRAARRRDRDDDALVPATIPATARRRSCRSVSPCSPRSCGPTRARRSRSSSEQGVEMKVLSGDAPETVGSIAQMPASSSRLRSTAESFPSDGRRAATRVLGASVVGRISPEGKRAVVEALSAEGRYVAMVGDGVNDVPALKAARLAIAQGSGTQMAKAVADVVLVNGRLRRGAGDGRGGPPDPAQHPARDEAVRDEVRLRRVPDRRDRDHAHGVPAAAAPPHDRRVAHRRDPRASSSRLRRARARGAPGVPARGGALRRARRRRRRARRARELPGLAERVRPRPAAGAHGGARR